MCFSSGLLPVDPRQTIWARSDNPRATASRETAVAVSVLGRRSREEPPEVDQQRYLARLNERREEARLVSPAAPSSSTHSLYQVLLENVLLKEQDPFALSGSFCKIMKVPSAENYQQLVKTFDAPGFENDYYLLQAGVSNKGRLAVVLNGPQGSCVYLKDVLVRSDVVILGEPYSSEQKPRCVHLGDSSNGIYLGLANGEIEYWTLDDGFKKELVYAPAKSCGKRVCGIGRIIEEDKVIYAGDQKGRLYRIHRKDGTVKLFPHLRSSEVTSLVLSPNKVYLASGTNDGSVVIWDLRTMAPVRELKMNGGVRAIAFHRKHPGYIVLGGGYKDRRVALFNYLESESVLTEIKFSNQVTTLLWRENRILATVSYEGLQIIPIEIGVKARLGSPLSVPTRCGRVLMSAMSELDGQDYLVLAGSNERIEIRALPQIGIKSEKKESCLVPSLGMLR